MLRKYIFDHDCSLVLPKVLTSKLLQRSFHSKRDCA
uniref:Uncharacterized protein n=1 Tax=Cucumis melo TaxID=3656 RepID=A0A9I9EFJ0_CUCME